MNPQEMMQILQSNNPMMVMQQKYGNTPAFQKAMEMMRGKNDQQLQQVVMNLAQQRGMDINQLRMMAQSFGLRL